MNQQTIQLVPYLHFNGDCEEALTTYQQILGGEINVVNRYDNPAMKAPEEYKNKILHAAYSFGGNTILASDTLPGSQLRGAQVTYHCLYQYPARKKDRKYLISCRKEGLRIFPLSSNSGAHGMVILQIASEYGGW